MKTHRTRLAAAAVCLLALAGCSDDGDGNAKAPSSSQTASPSETATSGASSGVAGLIEKSVALGSARVRMTIEDIDATASGVVDLGAAEPATDLTVKVPGEEDSRVVIVDGKLFMRSPQLGSEKFVELNAADPKNGALGFDPNGLLAQVKKLEGGDDLGNGHYRLSQKPLTFDLYFGEDELLRRATVAGTTSGTIDVRWTDWGQPVQVKAPPVRDRMPTATASPTA